MGLNLATTAVFLAGALLLLAGEIYGVMHKAKGDTITENWRFVNKWLAHHAPGADWAWRVLTIGLLSWAVLHFATGAP